VNDGRNDSTKMGLNFTHSNKMAIEPKPILLLSPLQFPQNRSQGSSAETIPIAIKTVPLSHFIV
jgi:hypothetical protein